MQTPRWFAPALLALALGLVLLAVLGPLGLEVIEYRYSETFLNQARGLDAFAVAVVAPVAVAAAVLARRGNPAAPFVALGPAGFATYMLTQYVIGPEYLVVDGNGERFFLLFVALFVLSAAVLLGAWGSAQDHALPVLTERRWRRRGQGLLVLCGFVVGVMYLANGFLSAMADFPEFVGDRAGATEYDEHPTAYWLVATLDLAVVVPVTAATGWALLHGRRWARRAFYGVIGWFALVPGSVAAMALVMVARDDPAADPAKAAMFTVVAVVLLGLALGVFAPLLRRSGPAGEPARQSPTTVASPTSMRSVTSSTVPSPSMRRRMPRSS